MAISTTGHEHRMPFLETCVRQWRSCLPLGSVLVVTVDGTEADAARVRAVVDSPQAGGHVGGNTYRVGQPHPDERTDDGHRLGVAASKNTGLELLMDTHNVEHLFLSDDDCWPLLPQALDKHTNMTYKGTAIPHSMVNWGAHRLLSTDAHHAHWTWPRGVMLYLHRDVVYRVGGFVEEFGSGGHEHVEYSNRINNAGFTPSPYVSPASYATRNAMGASALWHAEDMRRPGEPLGNLRQRRKGLTTITRTDDDWLRITAVMERMEGSDAYVGFRAHENGRSSATLSTNKPSQGADE